MSDDGKTEKQKIKAILKNKMDHLRYWQQFINAVVLSAETGKPIKFNVTNETCDKHVHVDIDPNELDVEPKQFLKQLEEIEELKKILE